MHAPINVIRIFELLSYLFTPPPTHLHHTTQSLLLPELEEAEVILTGVPADTWPDTTDEEGILEVEGASWLVDVTVNAINMAWEAAGPAVRAAWTFEAEVLKCETLDGVLVRLFSRGVVCVCVWLLKWVGWVCFLLGVLTPCDNPP